MNLMAQDDRTSYQLLNLVKAYINDESISPNEDFHDLVRSKNASLINPCTFTATPGSLNEK
jgi:hypothetical protein